MTKYEYTYVRAEGDFQARLKELNAFGAQGWKVEGIEFVGGGVVAYLMSKAVEAKDEV